MATEEHPTLEPVIWFEGTLIRDPLPLRVQDDWLLETLADPDGNGRKITIRARGAEHSENISRNARKGTRLMVKGTAGDEGRHRHRGHKPRVRPQPRRAGETMTRTTVSAAKPDKTDTGEWIDIHSHVGRLMSTLMAGGRPFSIDATSAGMTIITALSPQAVGTRDAETAAENDAENGTDPDGARITSRKTLYDRFKTKLNENLAERKQ